MDDETRQEFANLHQELNRQFENVAMLFEQNQERIDARFDKLEARMGGLEKVFERSWRVGQRQIRSLQSGTDLHDIRIEQLQGELRDLQERVQRLEDRDTAA